MQRREAGFTFIEILVVMGIIVVLMGMVAVIVPRAQEKARQTESTNNVKNIVSLLVEHCAVRNRWPRLDGKRFTLSPVAFGLVEPKNPDNLKIFFSPGDSLNRWDLVNHERYRDFKHNMDQLKNTDVHELTSYAGRRNGDREYLITPSRMKEVVPMISDDDEGPVHHPDGLVIGYTDGRVAFVEWLELGMDEPAELDDPEPFLGDNATVEKLRGVSSD